MSDPVSLSAETVMFLGALRVRMAKMRHSTDLRIAQTHRQLDACYARMCLSLPRAEQPRPGNETPSVTE